MVTVRSRSNLMFVYDIFSYPWLDRKLTGTIVFSLSLLRSLRTEIGPTTIRSLVWIGPNWLKLQFGKIFSVSALPHVAMQTFEKSRNVFLLNDRILFPTTCSLRVHFIFLFDEILSMKYLHALSDKWIRYLLYCNYNFQMSILHKQYKIPISKAWWAYKGLNLWVILTSWYSHSNIPCFRVINIFC